MKKIYVIICGVIIALVWGSLTYGELLVNKDREMIESADGTDFNQIKDGRNLFMCEKKVTYKDVTYETTYKDYVYDKEKDITAYRMVSDYVKSNNKRNFIFVVHRLDQDTSGILMFCKN
jgi:16S rRNA U516 pseudouridylate synthase RsuA-like enzyme